MNQSQKTHSAPLAVLLVLAAAFFVPRAGVRADPLSGGADPNLQSRIEQTAPGATERLLNSLRDNPPRYSAPPKKKLRARSSRHQHNNANVDAR